MRALAHSGPCDWSTRSDMIVIRDPDDFGNLFTEKFFPLGVGVRRRIRYYSNNPPRPIIFPLVLQDLEQRQRRCLRRRRKICRHNDNISMLDGVLEISSGHGAAGINNDSRESLRKLAMDHPELAVTERPRWDGRRDDLVSLIVLVNGCRLDLGQHCAVPWLGEQVLRCPREQRVLRDELPAPAGVLIAIP